MGFVERKKNIVCICLISVLKASIMDEDEARASSGQSPCNEELVTLQEGVLFFIFPGAVTLCRRRNHSSAWAQKSSK